MLRSYSAELNGSQLVWLEKPPERLVRQRVLIVVEDSKPVAEASPDKRYQLADLAGRLQWQGDALQGVIGVRFQLNPRASLLQPCNRPNFKEK